MSTSNQPTNDLRHIKKMMERSSRFISLSGLSGISAGICALAGAWFAQNKLTSYNVEQKIFSSQHGGHYLLKPYLNSLTRDLLIIALLTFISAFVTSFLFTYLRSKKSRIPLWGKTTYRLLWNISIPLLIGGLFLLRCTQLGEYKLLSAGCLVFYGLALFSASNYTLGEVKYLAYGQMLLGCVSLWMIGYELFFWAAGFGVLHIIYGLLMWFKYEYKSNNIASAD